MWGEENKFGVREVRLKYKLVGELHKEEGMGTSNLYSKMFNPEGLLLSLRGSGKIRCSEMRDRNEQCLSCTSSVGGRSNLQNLFLRDQSIHLDLRGSGSKFSLCRLYTVFRTVLFLSTICEPELQRDIRAIHKSPLSVFWRQTFLRVQGSAPTSETTQLSSRPLP